MAAVVEGEANARQGGQEARRARLLTAFHIAQEQYGWLSPQAVERVARRFDMVPSQVYATASFYILFKLAPQGRYRIQVCEGLSCYLAGGAEPVIDHVRRRLGLHYSGRTTSAGNANIAPPNGAGIETRIDASA